MDRVRRINRRRQGDLGEAAALQWLLSKGATVLVPFGESPDFDLVAELGGDLMRVQVKTSTQESLTSRGDRRCSVSLVTAGGNQSWTGVKKTVDPSTVDYLFVLTGDGRRWFIPSAALETRSTITLGGPKYAEYEIDAGHPIKPLVYGSQPPCEEPPIESPRAGEYPSGQRMTAVNRPALSFAGSNPASPIGAAAQMSPKPTKYERKLGQGGQAIINQKRRITIPQRAFFAAGFTDGSKVRVRADGPGRVIVEQVDLPTWARNGRSG